MQVNVFNLMTVTTALIETARDAAFNAVTAAAVTRMAAHYRWGGDGDAKLKTLTEVDAEMSEQFFAQNKDSNAYRWIKLAKEVSLKLNSDHKDTLNAAKGADSVDLAFGIVRNELKLRGADNLDSLELWAKGMTSGGGNKAIDHGKTLATLLAKHGLDLSEAAIDSAVKALGDLKAHMLMLRDQEAAKSKEAQQLRDDFAAAQKKAATAAKRAANKLAKAA